MSTTDLERNELDDLINLLVDQVLPQVQAVRLCDMLRGSAAAREQYVLRMGLNAKLFALSAEPRELNARPGATLSAMENAVTRDITDAHWRRLIDSAYRVVSTYMALSLIVASQVLTIIVLSMALIVPDWKRPEPVVEAETPSIEFVARIAVTSEATFDETSDGNLKNRDLFDDDKIVLHSGLVVIEYDSGARVVLEGPATYHVQGANGGDLRHGKLVARVDTKDAQGFVVDIPGARIVDLGTEFGVDVAADGTSEVAVLTGAVDLIAQADTAGPEQRLRLSAGQGASIEAASGKITRRSEVDSQLVKSYRKLLDRPFSPATVASATMSPLVPTLGVAIQQATSNGAAPWRFPRPMGQDGNPREAGQTFRVGPGGLVLDKITVRIDTLNSNNHDGDWSSVSLYRFEDAATAAPDGEPFFRQRFSLPASFKDEFDSGAEYLTIDLTDHSLPAGQYGFLLSLEDLSGDGADNMLIAIQTDEDAYADGMAIRRQNGNVFAAQQFFDETLDVDIDMEFYLHAAEGGNR